MELSANKTNKAAQFRTVIALCIEGKKRDFEGIVRGNSSTKNAEKKALAMTPFLSPTAIPEPLRELGNEVKNKISHRAKGHTAR